MPWKKATTCVLLIGCLEIAISTNSPRAHLAAPQTSRDRCSQQQGRGRSAWVPPFELLTEEELRWWKEDIFGPDKVTPQADSETPPTATENAGETAAENGRRKYGFGRAAAGLEGVSIKLGVATDAGVRALRAAAERSLQLGREGGIWLRRRWRVKAVYCVLGVYGVRIAGRLLTRMKASMLSSGDVLLDAEDAALSSRGSILDVEGQAILLELGALSGRSPSSSADASDASDGGDVTVNGESVEGCRGGWEAVEGALKRAISLRCAGGKRARYTEELSDALRCLEEARDETDMEILGSEHGLLVEKAVVVIQARLCDACLRSLRDGLVRSSADLSALSSYWKDRKSNHRRMGVIKSVALGTLVHGQMSGKRAAVEKDQEKVSTSELLLGRYLRRLGHVQDHLQARPKALLEETPDTAGTTLSQEAVESLEVWVDDGMEMFLRSVEEVEAGLQDPDYDYGSGGGDYASVSRGGAVATSRCRPANADITAVRSAAGVASTDSVDGAEDGRVSPLRKGVGSTSPLKSESVPAAASGRSDEGGWSLCRAAGTMLRGGDDRGGGGGGGSSGVPAFSSNVTGTRATTSSPALSRASVSRRTATALGCGVDERRGLATATAAARGGLGGSGGGIGGSSGGVVPAVVLLRSHPRKRRRRPSDDDDDGGGMAGQGAASITVKKEAKKKGLGSGRKSSAGVTGSGGARWRRRVDAGSSKKANVGEKSASGGAEDRDAALFGRVVQWLTGAVPADSTVSGASKQAPSDEGRRSWGGGLMGRARARAASESSRKKVGVSARSNEDKAAKKVADGESKAGREKRPSGISEGSWGWWKEVSASKSSGDNAKVGVRARVLEGKTERSEQSRGGTKTVDKEEGTWRLWKGTAGGSPESTTPPEASASANEGKSKANAKLDPKRVRGAERNASGKAQESGGGLRARAPPAESTDQLESKKSRVGRGGPKLGGGREPSSGQSDGKSSASAAKEGEGSTGWWKKMASSGSTKRGEAQAGGGTTKGTTTPKLTGGENNLPTKADDSCAARKEALSPKPAVDTTRRGEDEAKASIKAKSNRRRVGVGARSAAEGDGNDGVRLAEDGRVAGEERDSWLGPARRWITDPFHSGNNNGGGLWTRRGRGRKSFALTTASTLQDNERRRSGRDPPLRIDIEKPDGGGGGGDGVGDEPQGEKCARHGGRVTREGPASEGDLSSNGVCSTASGSSSTVVVVASEATATTPPPTAEGKGGVVVAAGVDVVEPQGEDSSSSSSSATTADSASLSAGGYSVATEMYERALQREEDARMRRAESVRQKRASVRARREEDAGDSAAVFGRSTETGEDAIDDSPEGVGPPSTVAGVNDNDDGMSALESTATGTYKHAPQGGSERSEGAVEEEGTSSSSSAFEDVEAVLEVGYSSAEEEDADDAAAVGDSTADTDEPSPGEEGRGVSRRGPRSTSAFVSTTGSQYERALQRRAWRAETALLLEGTVDGEVGKGGGGGGGGGSFVVGTATKAVVRTRNGSLYLRDSVARGVSAGCLAATTAVGKVGDIAAIGTATSLRACADCADVVISSPSTLIRKAAGFGAGLVFSQEDDNDDTAEVAVTDGRADGAAAGRVKVSELALSCLRLCRTVAGGVSAGCTGVAATLSKTGGVTVSAALNLGRAAADALVRTVQVCAVCASFMASSPVLLVRAVSSRKTATDGAVAVDGCAGASGGLKRRCVGICGSVVGGVTTGCLVGKATACLVGGTAARGIAASARWGAACVTCAGFVVLSPARLARAVLFHPRERRRRAPGGAGGRRVRNKKSATKIAVVSTSSGAEGMMRATARTVTPGEGVDEGGREEFETTGGGGHVQQAVANAEETAEQPALSATGSGDGGAQHLHAHKEGLAPSSKIFNMAAGVFVAKKETENAAPVDQSFWRDGRQQGEDAAAVAVAAAGRGGRQEGILGLAEELDREAESAASAAPSAAAAPPAFSSPWFESARASLGLATQDDDRATGASTDTTTAAAATAYSTFEPSTLGNNPPRKAAATTARADADAELARWVLTPPSDGVPERSGRRSRALIAGAARAAGVARRGTTAINSTAGSAGGAVGGGAAGLTRALRAKAVAEAMDAGAAPFAPRRRLRAALRLVVAGPLALRAGRRVRDNWDYLGGVRVEATAGLSSFFSQQLWEPCQAILKQVLFRQRSNLTDPAGLVDAETSLQNMLRDFVNDKRNAIAEDVREDAVAAMDMSVVSRKLEKETRGAIRGTVNGRIPRMLLIQVTFLKKELLQSMQAIDELFQANQVTLRLISVVPAALLIFGAVRLSKSIVHAVSSRRLEPTTRVHRDMRSSVRHAERLLTSSSGFAVAKDVGVPVTSGSMLLSDEETGELALCLHGLQTILRQNSFRFEARARRGLEEDLADMTRGLPTVAQQIAVVHRMQRSYPFLRPEGT